MIRYESGNKGWNALALQQMSIYISPAWSRVDQIFGSTFNGSSREILRLRPSCSATCVGPGVSPFSLRFDRPFSTEFTF